ncbi:GAF and ANTAR domain-containing protein [Streptomyces sp. NPDC046197]|uniref:GAF and ANTAR domain-containing protein n=1 Tax=Streptomyces sp. NPDC046197 TaxID=3154337 RepID=UPI0033D8631B
MTRYAQARRPERDEAGCEETVMSREKRLARAFVDLADTLSSQFDPLDLFERLSGHCVALLAVDAVAVVVVDARGRLRTVVASAADIGRLDRFQVEQHEGPAQDCHRTGEPVAEADLRAGGRWPGYTARALTAGYASVHVMPMRLNGLVIGVVSLMNRNREEVPETDLAVARGLCDVAAFTLVHWPAERRREHDLLTSVQAAVSAKATVELAKGLLSEHEGISFTEAYHLLHRYAQQERRPLTSVCRELAESRLGVAGLLREAGPL